MRITKDTANKLFSLYNSKHLKTKYGFGFLCSVYRIVLSELFITKKQVRDCKWILLWGDMNVLHGHNAELYIKTDRGYVLVPLSIKSSGVYITE